ncbi:hypothetical protein D3C71_1980990 [compost metagenome]
MPPQLGISGSTPRPRNVRLDSSRMLLATFSVIKMMTGPMMLGRMWWQTMARSRTPKARAA